MAKVLVLLDVNTDKLEELNSDFVTEMGWVEQSGITMDDYIEIADTDEEQRFIVEDYSIDTL